MKYIIVSSPHTYDCSITEFDDLSLALREFQERLGWSNATPPILAQVLFPIMSVSNIEQEVITLPLKESPVHPPA